VGDRFSFLFFLLSLQWAKGNVAVMERESRWLGRNGVEEKRISNFKSCLLSGWGGEAARLRSFKLLESI
jgi:hypothetical protein